MVDVDSLSATALSELDCLVRRKLSAIYPPGLGKVESAVDADTIFASLAALGLRLENRAAYADIRCVGGDSLRDAPTVKRVRNSVAWHTTHGNYGDYWHGFALETLMELGKYRGLFDDEGFLKEE